MKQYRISIAAKEEANDANKIDFMTASILLQQIAAFNMAVRPHRHASLLWKSDTPIFRKNSARTFSLILFLDQHSYQRSQQAQHQQYHNEHHHRHYQQYRSFTSAPSFHHAVKRTTAKSASPSTKVRPIAPLVSTKARKPLTVEETTAATTAKVATTEPPDAVPTTLLRKMAPSFTETYVAYGVCEALVKECARVADYEMPQRESGGIEGGKAFKNPESEKTAAEEEKKQQQKRGMVDGEGMTRVLKTTDGEELGVGKGWWYEDFHLAPTFNTWAQITFLHMWLLTVRVRAFPPDQAPTWHQHLINHFSYLAEDRMTNLHHVDARMTRNKYLKDLFIQWRGLTAAYDEGLVRGDAVLATALWRNVCKADAAVDLAALAKVVSYVRSVLHQLDGMDDEAIATGDVLFGDPGGETSLVGQRSKGLDLPLEEPVVESQSSGLQAKLT